MLGGVNDWAADAASLRDSFGDEPDPLFDDDFDLDALPGYPDPLEEPNRAILVFNQGLVGS